MLPDEDTYPRCDGSYELLWKNALRSLIWFSVCVSNLIRSHPFQHRAPRWELLWRLRMSAAEVIVRWIGSSDERFWINLRTYLRTLPGSMWPDCIRGFSAPSILYILVNIWNTYVYGGRTTNPKQRHRGHFRFIANPAIGD